MKQRVGYLLLAVVSLVGIVATPAEVWAQEAASTLYSVDEVFFGTGGQMCEVGTSGSSTNYCASSSAGALGVGASESTSYKAQSGYNTDREEYIEVVMNNATECGATASLNKNLGVLSTSSQATAVTYFSVKTYLASAGYVVRTVGAPPTVTSGASHTLATPNSGAGTNPAGTERFGINLVANTTPSVGANPVQYPDSSFSSGQAATGYDTPNSFRYVDGEIIADSDGNSSGTTCYTMSYLYNIGGGTPAGEYLFTQSVVATSTY